jgi:hypothetical protein
MGASACLLAMWSHYAVRRAAHGRLRSVAMTVELYNETDEHAWHAHMVVIKNNYSTDEAPPKRIVCYKMQ